jgi:hypothetical protein
METCENGGEKIPKRSRSVLGRFYCIIHALCLTDSTLLPLRITASVCTSNLAVDMIQETQFILPTFRPQSVDLTLFIKTILKLICFWNRQASIPRDVTRDADRAREYCSRYGR